MKHSLAIAALIALTATPFFANAGSTRGETFTKETVKAYDTDRYVLTFRGDEKAVVAVNGDGDTDLDLYIYDENGNLIASDTDSTDSCVATWTPKWTGKFTIKVVNRGSVYNRYEIATN